MDQSSKKQWDGLDRRNHWSRRASGRDRRTSEERRCDRRSKSICKTRSLKAWIRTFTNPRLGVDRRKGVDQRNSRSRRDICGKTLLSNEELTDLLK